MHFTSPEIYSVLQKLLTTVGVTHPQALVCPISVARNTMNKQQKAVASHVLNAIRKKQSQLVEEASMVSRELMRVAISPHELWKAGLDMAYTHYMNRDESIPRSVNVRNMLDTLTQMHDAMEHEEQDASCAATTGTSSMSMYTSRKQGDEGFTETSGKIGTVTLRDISFRHQYGRQLAEAKDLLDEFRKTGTTLVLHRLWNVYFSIIMRMDKSLATQSKVQLHHVSRDLTSSRGLRLCVPGTYVPNGPEVSIAKFVNTLSIISSKQRPRRMAMLGSDGRTYEFLLKGKEDLRQDERVMQLFGLINVCLDNNQGTNRQSLKIVQYSVLPLSNNSGVIGWLQNCDTLHALLSQYRSERNIPQLLETVLLRQKLDGGAYLKKYDRLPDLAKVEVFSSILEQTTGKDLEKMLWLKSGTADSWVGRRESFTRSMAVMSIVGYILGLGDRHMANIMLDRVSGRVIHIDFGDCFEVNKTRSVYPETVPFRLTRMLTNCMGSSGMTGTFKATSYRVMRVLHENRDSVMAMLEAFVYDPMVSWRVLANESTPANNPGGGAAGGDNNPAVVEIGEPGTTGLSETATNSKTLNASLNGQAVAKEFGAAEERAMQQSLSQAMSWSQSLFNRQRLSVSGYGGGVTGTTSSHAASAAQQGLADVDPLVDGLQASISHVMRESVGRRDSYLQMPSMRATDARGTSYGNSTLYETGESTPLTVSTGAVPSLPTLTMTPSQAPSMRGSQSGTDLATSAAAVLDVSADKNDDEAAPLQEDLNARAVEVINRIHSKLTGRDFATTDDDNDILTVEQQVDRLINEATSIENLCKLYFGWNPWW
jgi:phosphatidylinositol kinase/protein kinase (PI-3  family)